MSDNRWAIMAPNKLKRFLHLSLVATCLLSLSLCIQGCSYEKTKDEAPIIQSVAEVIRYDSELNVLLIRNEHGYVLEVRVLDQLVVFDQGGVEISVGDLQPGQQVLLSVESRPTPLEWTDPVSTEASSAVIYCIRIDVI